MQAFEEPIAPPRTWRDQVPLVVAGLMLTAAFAFAGHYIGRSAVAHNADAGDMVALVSPTSALSTKGSLLPEDQNFSMVNANDLRRQTVMVDGKGDLIGMDLVQPVPAPLPKPKPKSVAAIAKDPKVKISPVSVDLKHEDDAAPSSPVKRMALIPAPAQVDKKFTLNADEKHKVVVQHRLRLAEENCLARAVYFESRSESDLGQLAVAKVILNRVKSPDYPKTICGVVYQGSGTRNSCQFSFACDGLPDDVKSPEAWAHAKMIAQRAINNDPAVSMLGSATNYHADYVKPRWAKTMRRLARIGHHIFYANG
jgi:spore germination cell wall hydrolase CwlJ-like protein